jgi:hypothetical protein
MEQDRLSADLPAAAPEPAEITPPPASGDVSTA